MPLQRACDAESQVRNTMSNGPRRAQSNVHTWICTEYSATLQADVICRGYVSILLRAQECSCEYKVAPRICEFALDRRYLSVRDFFVMWDILQGFFTIAGKRQKEIVAMQQRSYCEKRRWRHDQRSNYQNREQRRSDL